MNDDLALVYMWAFKKGEEKSKKRIEELEAALQLYAGLERDGIKWEPLNDNGGVARATLGEKK